MAEELLPRRTTALAREILGFSPILTIEGARQVGKSTLAGQLAEGQSHGTFSLDDRQVLDAARADPAGFVAQVPEGVMVIDEIQRFPELTLAVKAEVDRDRRPGRFILTGSSDLARIRGRKDSLAGRAMNIHLRPLSEGEIRRSPTDDLVAAVSARASDGSLTEFSTEISREETISLIVRGGYPTVRAASARMRGAWFDDYVDRLIRVDTGEMGSRLDPERLRSLLNLLAANQSGELVKARVAQEAGIPASTATAYLDALRRMFLVEEMLPWTPNLTSREINRRKAYVADSGLCARLMRTPERVLNSLVEGAKPLGALLEGFVAMEMSKQQSWARVPFRLYHYRDRDRAEVDLIAELDDGGVVGFEVKASTSFNRGQFSGLSLLRDELGDRFIAGVVLNLGTSGYRFADRLYGLPVAALWQLGASTG